MARPVTARRLPPYRGGPYWEEEEPEEARTDRIALAYYPRAGKLQVSVLWPDPVTGAKRRGKTVTLDEEDFRRHPDARALLARLLGE